MSDDETLSPDKFQLIPANEDELSLVDIGSGPQYDALLQAEAEKYKVGDFIENRAISAVRMKP